MKVPCRQTLLDPRPVLLLSSRQSNALWCNPSDARLDFQSSLTGTAGTASSSLTACAQASDGPGSQPTVCDHSLASTMVAQMKGFFASV